MQLTYKYNILYNPRLIELFTYSKNLYNQANYLIKQELDKNRRWIRYYELDKILKQLEPEFDNYHKLKAQCSQQILRQIDKDWTSYFRSIKLWKTNKESFNGQPKPPRYKSKYNILIFTNQNCKIKNNQLHLYKDLIINIPLYKDFTNFNQVRILPKNNHIEIEIIYEQQEKEKVVNGNYGSIDLGINNLITFVSEERPLIISGKQIKSINQFYNKQISKLQEKTDKRTKKMNIITDKRNRKIKDLLHKTSKFIIDHCIEKNIGNIVVGYNKQWKTSMNLGKRTNQTFTNIPYHKLINMIKYKALLSGLNVVETEESYTSKCDSLALEEVKKHDKYLGKRKFRGMFISSINKMINADVNGALNILRKVVHESIVKKIMDSGLLFRPIRINNLFLINQLINSKG